MSEAQQPHDQTSHSESTLPVYFPSAFEATHPPPPEKQKSLEFIESPSPPRYSSCDLEKATAIIIADRKARKRRVWACAAVGIVLCAMVVGVAAGVVVSMKNQD